MNYYKRHIGDYLKDTAHLSLLEHGIYTRLLDVYYTREAAIPEAQAARLIGVRSKEERAVLLLVLQEFFWLEEGVWRQKRCEVELADKEVKAETNRINGRLGGRPKKVSASAVTANQIVLPENPSGFENTSQSEPTVKPSQQPVTISHQPLASGSTQADSAMPLQPPSETVQRIGYVCRLLRDRGVLHVSPAQFQSKYQGLEQHSDDDFYLAVQTLQARGEQRIGLGLVAAVLGDMAQPRRAPRSQLRSESFANLDYGNGGRL